MQRRQLPSSSGGDGIGRVENGVVRGRGGAGTEEKYRKAQRCSISVTSVSTLILLAGSLGYWVGLKRSCDVKPVRPSSVHSSADVPSLRATHPAGYDFSAASLMDIEAEYLRLEHAAFNTWLVGEGAYEDEAHTHINMAYAKHTPYFDLYRPIREAACPGKIHSVGEEGKDGSKFICFGDDGNVAISKETEGNPIVYSLGSNNNFHFEREMASACPECEIHTFDCFAQYMALNPERAHFDIEKFNRYFPRHDEAHERVHLHKMCIGEPPSDWPSNSNEPPPYSLLRDVMRQLGHSRISLLKIDIEGAEYDVLGAMGLTPTLGASSAPSLPTQISIELHVFSRSSEKESRNALILAQGLRTAGYVPISREDNVACTFCSEFTFFMP